MKNIFIYPVEAVNAVRTNVWSVILIVIGTILTIHGHSDAGAPMITGGFALLRTEVSPNSGVSINSPSSTTKDPNTV